MSEPDGEGILRLLKASVPFHLALIAVLGLLAYSNTFDVPFHWDDKGYIAGNPVVQDFSYFTDPSKSLKFKSYSNVPLTRKTRSVAYLTFLANYRAHGFRVAGYHAVNLLIHILNSLLLYWLVILSFETPFLRKSSLKARSKYMALFTGLLFVSHPLQTQAVTYISQRFASLAAFFYLLSVLAYVRSRVSGGNIMRYAFYALSLLSAVLAMKTKENAFTLPLAITLCELAFFGGTFRKRTALLIPPLLTMLIIPLSVLDFDMPFGKAITEATRTQAEISRHDYFVTQFRVIVTYLRLLILPVNQNLDYDYPVFRSFLDPQVLSSSLFLLSLLLTGIYLFSRARAADAGLRFVSFGIIWFFLTLSVESGFILVEDVFFEHRVYLPSAGAFLSMATGAFLLIGRPKSKKAIALATPALVLLPLVFSCATYARNSVWGSEISLWEDVVRKSPGKARGYYNLGNAYAGESGPPSDRAIENLRIAVRLKPDFADAHFNLGLVYLGKGLGEEARKEFAAALKINPSHQAKLFLNYIADPEKARP